MKNVYVALILLLCAGALKAQKFEAVDSAYTPLKVKYPKSPAEFQVLFVGGVDVVKNHDGEVALAKEWHDFLGFVEKNGKTYLISNHERIVADDVLGDGGGMTVWEIEKKADGSWSRVGDFRNVDFSKVGGTLANCGGMQSKDGRIWTAEEWMQRSNVAINGYGNCLEGIRDTSDYTISGSGIPAADGETIKKYENFNWLVEVDVEKAEAIRKQYNMGRFGHEGGAVASDNKTVYLTDDSSPAGFYKFVADKAGDFTTGKLSVYKQDEGKYTGSWVEVPQSTIEDLINVQANALDLGATLFMRGEWIEEGPDGKIYWTETGRDDAGKRFVGTTTAAPKTRVAKHHIDLGYTDDSYADYYGRVMVFDPKDNSMKLFLNGGDGTTKNDDLHLSNPDGLTFAKIDNKDFMVVQEDLNGTDQNRIPSHAKNGVVCEMFLLEMKGQATADVDDLLRLAVMPVGAEITGARASSDGSTIFFNVQHPFRKAGKFANAYENRGDYNGEAIGGGNDAYGKSMNIFPFNHSMTCAIYNLDAFVFVAMDEPDFKGERAFEVYPNPATQFLHLNAINNVEVYDISGRKVAQKKGVNRVDISHLSPGSYIIKNDTGNSETFIIE